MGKWNAYDPSLRVPMFMRGPGIAKGRRSKLLGSHVDLAPTWLGLAGIDTPPEMDGRSLVSAIVNVSAPEVSSYTRQHAERQTTQPAAAAGYRPENAVYVSYHGLGPVGAPGRWMDALNNTYRVLRYMGDPQYGDMMYAEFAGDFNFDTVVFHGGPGTGGGKETRNQRGLWNAELGAERIDPRVCFATKKRRHRALPTQKASPTPVPRTL